MPHILVIEDDLEFRGPLVKMLTNDGHKVSIAGDGVRAVMGGKVMLAKPFSRAQLRQAIHDSLASPVP